MKFLSISPVSPYDDIGHAGGKTYNYYLKNISKKIDVNALLFVQRMKKIKRIFRNIKLIIKTSLLVELL